MPVLTALSILIGIIKVAMEISAYLKEHPQFSSRMREVLSNVNTDVAAMHHDLREEAHRIPEAP